MFSCLRFLLVVMALIDALISGWATAQTPPSEAQRFVHETWTFKEHPVSLCADPLKSSGDSLRTRVMGEDKIVIFGGLMAREAGLVQCLVARFAVLEVGETPAACRGVSF